MNGTTRLGHRGTGRAAGPAGGWPRSCAAAAAAAAGRTHKPLGRRCRREVCPEEEVCCPPSQLNFKSFSGGTKKGGQKLNYLARVIRKAV